MKGFDSEGGFARVKAGPAAGSRTTGHHQRTARELRLANLVKLVASVPVPRLRWYDACGLKVENKGSDVQCGRELGGLIDPPQLRRLDPGLSFQTSRPEA